MEKHNEVHIFIDETGDLPIAPADNNKSCLVGGVVYFGNYAEINQQLEDIIEDELEKFYNGDLQELHYHNFTSRLPHREYWLKKNRFLAAVAERLRKCSLAKDMLGLSIRHVEDADDARATLNENEHDNRYLFMLLSLIEQLLFIEFSDWLTDDAKVCLHVASRTLTLPNNDPRVPELRETMRRRRPNFEIREENGMIRIPFFHTVAEIEGAINNMIRYRWPNFQYQIEARVEPIIYEHVHNNGAYRKLSQCGYYLADLFLGLKRHQLEDGAFYAHGLILDELLACNYETATLELARCEADLANNSRSRFLALLREQPRVAANGLFADFKSRFAQSVTDAELLELWKTTLSKVDSPTRGDFAQAREIFDNIEEVTAYRQAAPSALSAEIAATRICVLLAFANHSGAINEGDDVWQDYEELENSPNFKLLSPERLIEYQSEIRRRRVVNLLDAFRFADARQRAQECVDLQKQLFVIYQNFAAQRPQLGYALSQLAQIETICGDLENALRHFDEAATHYDPVENAGDVERNNIYLGHLACEMANAQFGDGGVALWTRTCEALPLLGYDDERNVWPLLEDMKPNRFLVALLLKGAFFFAHDHSATNLVLQWNGSELKKTIDASLQAGQSFHPDGMILQSIAALAAKFPRFFPNAMVQENYEAAQKSFEQAQTPLMTFLAAVAKTRKFLFKLEANAPNAKGKLADALKQTKKALENPAFSQDLWQNTPDEIVIFGRRLALNAPLKEKAQAVLAGVRFNYY